MQSETRIMRYDVHTKVPAVETNIAAAPRAAQLLTAADGTRHPLIEVSSDSSDDEVAADGLRVVLAPLDPAAAPEQRKQATPARITSARRR